jgi:hypothetical protein
LELENTEKCIETLKTLDRQTMSAGRAKLLYNIQRGEVLKKKSRIFRKVDILKIKRKWYTL